MPIKPRQGKVTGLRALLLVALVLVVGGVSGLLYFGRSGAPKRRAAGDEISKAEKGTTLLGQDFDYTYTQGERPVFRIRGESIRADKENTVFLDKVGVTIYDRQGRPFEVESRQASFQRTTNEGQLRGEVRLRGPGELILRTAALDVLEQGRVLITERPAEIHFADQYLAWGQKLTLRQNEQLFTLEGKVNVTTLADKGPAMSLNADRLVYERTTRQLRVEGGAELTRDQDHLTADRITAFLDADERSVLFVRALYKVSGEARAPDKAKAKGKGEIRVRFRGDDLAVLLEPAGPPAKTGREPRTVALEGAQGRPEDKAELQTLGGGVTRTLRARRVEGHMAAGVLTAAEGFGGVEMNELGAGGAVLRHAVGQRAQASFKPDGQVGSLALQEEVAYKDPQIEVRGDRGQMSFESGQGEFFGRPVHARSERGEFRGPHLTYDRSTGILHGEDGVQALLKEEQAGALGGGSPLAQGEGPVHVDGKEAFLRDKPRSFLFRGDVRAWRGESVLTAKELRGDQAVPAGGAAGDKPEDRLTATGGVKTLYIPRPETAAAGGAGARGSDGESDSEVGTPQKPIEVTASDLVYLSGKGLLTYTGQVRAVQEGRTLTCQQLEVALGKDKKVETMNCTGQAHLVDAQTGRDMQGDRAFYRVKDRIVEMYGNPVHLLDKEGNRLQGKHVNYFMRDGRVEVKGDPPVPGAAPAPTATPAKPAAPPLTPPTPPLPARPPGPPGEGGEKKKLARSWLSTRISPLSRGWGWADGRGAGGEGS